MEDFSELEIALLDEFAKIALPSVIVALGISSSNIADTERYAKMSYDLAKSMVKIRRIYNPELAL